MRKFLTRKILTTFLVLVVMVGVAFAGTPTLKKFGLRLADEGADHSTPPSGYGELYVNSDALTYINDSGTVTTITAGSGDNTLDNAYDQGGAGAGKAITVDTGAIALSNTDADTAWLMTMNAAPSGSAALGGLQITCGANSTQDALEFVNGGSGYDIYGTSGTWTISKAGTGSFANATVTGTLTATDGVTFENLATLTNSTNSEIRFLEADEDLILDMDSTTNVVGLKSTTGVTGLAMGTVDDLSGIGTLAFDAAASTVTLAASGDAQDLTLQVTGAHNSSMHLAAAGTGADAITIATSAGGMDLTVAGSAAGEDLDLTSASSINLTAAEAAADAIVLNASTALGGIDITSNADIDITTTGASGEDISLTNTGGSIALSATEAAADAISLAATTGAGGITINAGSSGITFSDDSITNVGDIACDDITSDADTDVVISAVKSIVKTIDVNDDASTDDYQFDDDAANTTEQVITLTNIVPAWAEVVSVQVRCLETVTGSQSMSIDVGTASGGDQVLAAASPDTANDLLATAAAESPELASAAAARSLYVNATPGGNWSTLDAGRWAIIITYIDYGAAYTQSGS